MAGLLPTASDSVPVPLFSKCPWKEEGRRGAYLLLKENFLADQAIKR